MKQSRAYDAWTSLVHGLLCAVSPRSAAQWTVGRNAAHMVLSNYQAATRKGPHGHRRPSMAAADELIQRDIREVTARCRDLARNNTRIKGALRSIASNVVFNGFRPQVQFKAPDGTKDTPRNLAMEAHWKKWAKAVGWWDIEKFAVNHNWADGGMFVRFFLDPTLLDRGIVPLGVEPLEMDHLDTTRHGPQPNGRICHYGIEFDALGHVAGYWLYPQHPGNTAMVIPFAQQSKFIPASDVIHVYERERISQTRGVSWLAPLVMDVYELDDYEAAARITAKLQAAMGVWFKTATAAQYGGDFPGMGEEQGIDGYAYASEHGKVPDHIPSGGVVVAPPGLEPVTVSSTQPGPDYEPFVRSNLQGMSCGLGVTYEAFSHDYAKSTYSSARNGSIDERRNYRMQQFFLLAKLHGPTWERWCSLLAMSGLEPGAEAAMPALWLLPGWPWVDPRNDAAAAQAKIAMGTSSRQKQAAEQGEDFHEITDQLLEEAPIMARIEAAKAPNAGGDGQRPTEGQ